MNPEKYVSFAIARKVPALGICGGAQLLSMICGGVVKPNGVKEIGCYQVDLTSAGQGSSLFEGFPSRFPVVQWHGDTFSIPPGGVHLASSPDCTNQAFSLNQVFGIQFHIETGRQELERWVRLYDHELPAVQKTGEQIIREYSSYEEKIISLGRLLLKNFLNQACKLEKN